MSTTVLNRGYFAPIDLFSAAYNAETILWETCDNYQKQTYRNRQYIYGANGKLLLNIPIKHNTKKGEPQPYTTVEIENKYRWQLTHWRSIESAYRTSPFFEFYEDDLKSLYTTPFKFLHEFNTACWEALFNCFQLDKTEANTSEYIKQYPADTAVSDCRHLIIAKRQPAINLEAYQQVFEEKYGFLENLSILDLLFNEGPESERYLIPVSGLTQERISTTKL